MGNYFSLGNTKRVHFIGIGGISMSGLAETLYRNGYAVSGSDKTVTHTTEHLRKVGINVIIGRGAQNISSDIDLVVYTAAIKPDDPELSAARSLNIPTMVRAELLGAILKSYEYAICVAGTHGKTSTTALIAEIALAAGLDPTVNIGGYIGDTNYYIGSSPYFILEACEYSNSFHHWRPYIGVILNIDADHMDFYGSMDAIIKSFAIFAQNISPSGTLVIQEGVPGFDKITAGLKCKIVTFNTDAHTYVNTGKVPDSRYRIRNITFNNNGTPSFDIIQGSKVQANVKFPLPGRYNMHNALAAFVVAHELGVRPYTIAGALAKTQGVKRRYQYKGLFNGAVIIDDYAHHPTEIKECLAAARESNPDRIICLFQPHTYTRTRDLFDDFIHSFGQADIMVFVPIYAAREPYDPSISASMLAKQVAGLKDKNNVINCENLEEAEAWLRGKLVPGDLLITMGAGDVYFVGERLLAR